jgi:hypothetical protein
MDDTFSFWVGFVVGGIVLGVLGATLGIQEGEEYTTKKFEYEIIERGYGGYCPKTGEFSFIGECDVSTR